MGGDHKCPVCQATFTRPQHVARHMRSHTGDRPYKCQCCGDQFARSDLLSRHINKCHANEKPLLNQGSRRKGSAAASRATTSKQACDQCVQSSLPCDGSNPCAKCVQRKCRCTYVKFHRQTAPIGPGHNPRPTAPSTIPGPSSSSNVSSSSRIPISYSHSDDFFLAPAPSSSVPTMAETLYQSQTFAFPPLYPDPTSATTSSADFTSKYRAQAELLRNGTMASASSSFSSSATGSNSAVGPGIPPSSIYSDPRSASGSAPWVSWAHEPSDSYHAQHTSIHDKDMHPSDLSHRLHSQQQQQQQHQHQSYQQQYVHNHGIPHDSHQTASPTVGSYPHTHSQSQVSAPYMRGGSVEFGGSEGSGSTVPSSATSSSVHLPLDNLSIQSQGQHHPQSLPFNSLENFAEHRSDDFAGSGSGSGGSSLDGHPSNAAAGRGGGRTSAAGKVGGGGPSSSSQQQQQQQHHQHSGLHSGEGGFSSAFGFTSSDDPNTLAGLATATDDANFFGNMNMLSGVPVSGLASLAADDPDATPMPVRENPPMGGGGGAGGGGGGQSFAGAAPVALTLPIHRSASTSAAAAAAAAAAATGGSSTQQTSGNGTGTTPKDGDMRELKEFWKQYVRTPWSGPGTGPGGSTPDSQNTPQYHQQMMSPPFRRPRVASMPSSKTPTVTVSGMHMQQQDHHPQQQQQQQHQQHQQQQSDEARRGESGVRTTLQEDLRSYEAAVLARKAPTNLNLVPRVRRGTAPALNAGPPNGHVPTASSVVSGKGVAVVPIVKFDSDNPDQNTNGDMRLSSHSPVSNHMSASAPVPLSSVFNQSQYTKQSSNSPHLSHSFPVNLMHRRSPASVSSAGDTSSRASSVSVDQELDTDDDGAASATGSVASGTSSSADRFRPPFKRLASTTLGPPNSKRQYLSSPTLANSEGPMTVEQDRQQQQEFMAGPILG